MTSLKIRDVPLGIGRPKIIVPLIEAGERGLFEAARQLADHPVDMVEWRADRFEGCRDSARSIDTAGRIRALIGERPLIYTLRTSHEGGEWKPTSEQYRDLIADLCASKVIDAVDIQYANPEARRCFKAAKAAKVPIIASSHDFLATPSLNALTDRLDAMAAMGADVCKLAVMPHHAGDVLTLLETTRRWSAGSRIPLMSMSMGPLGVISRVSGAVFGSCATFASLGDAVSAPGQLPLPELIAVMEALGRDLPV